MKSNSMFSGTISVLERALDLRSTRHNMLVSNVVNQDTPHYQAFDTEMDDAFKQLAAKDDNLGLDRTHPGHMVDGSSVSSGSGPVSKIKRATIGRADGNTVDIERSMVDMASNTIMYNAMSQIISKKFAKLRNAITGGKP